MSGPRRSWRRATLVVATVGVACGKPEPAAPEPGSKAPEPTEVAEVGEPAEASADRREQAAAPAPPTGPRVELAAEFHRTRVGPGRGFWVLATLHNTSDRAMARLEARVRLLDVDGEQVAEAIGELQLVLGPDARAPVTVLVPTPVEHESLVLEASGVALDVDAPPELPLSLEHEEPMRADLGGWYVVGRIHNEGAAIIRGARLEVQGLDGAGKLLGVDWAVLDDIGAGETVEFDVGGLRYEQVPASFVLNLRPPPT